MTQKEIAITVATQRAYDVYLLARNTNDGELQYKTKEAYNFLVYTAMELGYTTYPMDESHNREILMSENYECSAYWVEEE